VLERVRASRTAILSRARGGSGCSESIRDGVQEALQEILKDELSRAKRVRPSIGAPARDFGGGSGGGGDERPDEEGGCSRMQSHGDDTGGGGHGAERYMRGCTMGEQSDEEGEGEHVQGYTNSMSKQAEEDEGYMHRYTTRKRSELDSPTGPTHFSGEGEAATSHVAGAPETPETPSQPPPPDDMWDDITPPPPPPPPPEDSTTPPPHQQQRHQRQAGRSTRVGTLAAGSQRARAVTWGEAAGAGGLSSVEYEELMCAMHASIEEDLRWDPTSNPAP
jgi:hypothetical protein